MNVESKTTGAGELEQIAQKYELMIEDVRERIHDINERMKPLTAEIETIEPLRRPTRDYPVCGRSKSVAKRSST
jgi:hypothetical protein